MSEGALTFAYFAFVIMKFDVNEMYVLVEGAEKHSTCLGLEHGLKG